MLRALDPGAQYFTPVRIYLGEVMNMKRKRIALLYGGVGVEHEVSVSGAKYLLDVIDKKRYLPYPVFITKDGRWYAEGNPERPVCVTVGSVGALTEGERAVPIRAAFPLLHGDGGEDGKVQGLLECAGIPYVGCKVTAGAVASDKILTKDIAAALGIPTVPGIAIVNDTSTEGARVLAESRIGYPMFIKPSGLGSSLGAHAVYSPEEFAVHFDAAIRLGGKRVLIEELIEDKRELECAYLAHSGGSVFTPPGEIISHGVYDYDEKYGKNSRTVTRPTASVPDKISETVRDYSERLVSRLGISGLSRIDFFLSGGELLFNEINTMPGFTETSLYPAMIAAAGIDPTELVTELIEGAAL